MGNPVEPNPRGECFGDWFERVLSQQFPVEPLLWIRGANFAVTNARIVSQPVEFYQRLIAECDSCVSPETGHFFERAWQKVFAVEPRYLTTAPRATDRAALARRLLLLKIDTRSNDFVAPEVSYPVHEVRCHDEVAAKFAARNPHLADHPPYHVLTSMFNSLQAARAGMVYQYRQAQVQDGRATSWIKLQECIRSMPFMPFGNDDIDVVVVLDTDAWVVDPDALLDWAGLLVNSPELFMFADEPTNAESFNLLGIRQRVNGGMMMMKNVPAAADALRQVYALADTPDCSQFKLHWSWEQICLSKALLEDDVFKRQVMISPLTLFNTPAGRVVRHCWCKQFVSALLIRDLLSAVNNEPYSAGRFFVR
jgi:hypothetical protein